MNDTNKIYWVKGNSQDCIIPLEEEVIPQEGDVYTEPFYPEEGATIEVNFVGKYKKKTYIPSVDGNLLLVHDDGTLSSGLYSVEIIITDTDGTRHRSMWSNQVVVTESNESVLEEWDEFKSLGVTARAALFFFAKGDKGDQGIQGEQGEQGIQGEKGDAGTAATIAVGSVTTGEAGTQASVTNSGTSSNAVFDFTIPKGDKGEKGDKGDAGNYTKPQDGIPSTDMTEKVQTSLGKADASLQEITDEQFNEIFNN